MSLNEIPVNVAAEEGIDMLVTALWCKTVEREILPVAYPGHQANAEQMGQTERHGILRLGIPGNFYWLDIRCVL